MKTKSILSTIVFSMLMAVAFAGNPKSGKVLITVSIEVKSFPEWKKMFDAGAPVREKAGIKVLSIASTIENENKILVIEEAPSLQAAKDFLEVLRSRQKAGDMSVLDVKLFNQEN